MADDQLMRAPWGDIAPRLGGSSAPVDLDTGQRTQSWLAVSDDPTAMTSGGYWHDRQRQKPALEALGPAFQDELLARLRGLTNVELA